MLEEDGTCNSNVDKAQQGEGNNYEKDLEENRKDVKQDEHRKKDDDGKLEGETCNNTVDKTQQGEGNNCEDVVPEEDLDENLNKEHRWETNSRFMIHVAKKHMIPMHRKGKSYFISQDVQYVFKLVKETMKTPLKKHRYDEKKGVYQKRFLTQVGLHGKLYKPCCTVTVIVNLETNKMVTAFPTL